MTLPATPRRQFSNAHVIGKKEKTQREYPPYIYTLLYLFVLYMTLPIIEIPLLGLSVSAPLIFIIALQVFFRSQNLQMNKYSKWIFLVFLIWAGIFLSATLNGFLTGGIRVDISTGVALLQYAYWFLTFVLIVYLFSSDKQLFDKSAELIALGIGILGVLRFGEAIFGGATGAWMRLRVMSENGYGIQFSMFYPVLLTFLYVKENRKWTILGIVVLLASILMNGSRSNWIATALSTFLVVVMMLFVHGKVIRTIFIVVFLAGMIVLGSMLAPQPVVNAFQQRFSTLDRLDQDKSYAIRQLMIQKGIRLYQSSPWIGVGISRWRKETIPLDIPRVLQYASQSHFDRKSSHNSYISYLAESGLAGTIPLGILLFVLTFLGFRNAIMLARDGRVWAIGIYAGFVGMSIHLWALSGLTGTVTWFVYALVASVIVLGRDQTRKEKKKRASRFSLSRSRRR